MVLHSVVYLSLFLTSATALATSSSQHILKSTADTCWVGQIHDPCNGATTGCTFDGYLVKCNEDHNDPSQSAMIFDSDCDGASGTYRCRCDANGDSSCTSCWVGQIHDPCNFATTGCTPDGILVKCDTGSPDPADNAMIFADMCGPATGGPWTCHCEDGVSKC